MFFNKKKSARPQPNVESLISINQTLDALLWIPGNSFRTSVKTSRQLCVEHAE